MAKKKKNARDRLSGVLSAIKSPTFSLGFNIIDKWVDCGSYAINRRMSGFWEKCFLFGRNYVLYGESGSAKSLLLATTCANAQKNNDALIVWIDVEKATDDEAGKSWLKRAGVDIDNNFIFATAATLGDIKTVISAMCRDYRKMMEEDEEELADATPIIFAIDSWSAAMTDSQYEQAVKGEMKGDQGQKAKQTGDVINAITHLVTGLPILVIGVMHVMDNQDQYAIRKHKTTGGNKAMYMASGALLLTKKEMKDEDVDDKDVANHYKKLTDGMTAELKKKKRYVGIVSTMEVLKSRVSKPFERVDIQIPFLTGIDRYSGMFEVMMQEGVFTQGKQGWYEYNYHGEMMKFQKGSFKEHVERLMEISDEDIALVKETVENENDEITTTETFDEEEVPSKE